MSAGEQAVSCSGGDRGAVEIKLEQSYLLGECKGRGLGGRMLRRVEVKIRTQRRARLSLAVNKGNTDSIAVYRKSGHVVRKEAVFENGYVMANRL